LNIYGPKELRELIEKMLGMAETKLSYAINWKPTSDEGLNLLFEDKKVEVFSFPLKHRIYCTGFLFREKPLPRKIDKYRLEQLKISFADILALKAGHDIVNIDGDPVKNSDATLDPLPPRAFAYCSDTAFFPEVVVYVRDVDLLYHESTFLQDNAERAMKTFHSTARQAAEIAKAANARQLLLGHYSARYRDLQEFVNEAQAIFSNSMLATDGKKIEI
jgi:ribonuclease Z